MHQGQWKRVQTLRSSNSWVQTLRSFPDKVACERRRISGDRYFSGKRNDLRKYVCVRRLHIKRLNDEFAAPQSILIFSLLISQESTNVTIDGIPLDEEIVFKVLIIRKSMYSFTLIFVVLIEKEKERNSSYSSV